MFGNDSELIYFCSREVSKKKCVTFLVDDDVSVRSVLTSLNCHPRFLYSRDNKSKHFLFRNPHQQKVRLCPHDTCLSWQCLIVYVGAHSNLSRKIDLK